MSRVMEVRLPGCVGANNRVKRDEAFARDSDSRDLAGKDMRL
ncbi:hypothetical protein SAMN05192564_11175 [Paraburkholderia sartisoli]|uniref:Uncharacterized protein n=1 Tax=Paraburkholderia sartisoli TaxID=83784 RepID=A0A1H4HN09_9BURK|nr:hypothetical protein SAMN05192564_11175 [Paraburkholderia sartisoli]